VPVLERCGLPIAVANAVPQVKRLAAHVTQAAGGHGAVREVIDALLEARGELAHAMATYRTHADRTS
jgi:3-deoxy-D-manno-octulosonate 8-phosphate phosphatase (KDO 8-P phosphatase)